MKSSDRMFRVSYNIGGVSNFRLYRCADQSTAMAKVLSEHPSARITRVAVRCSAESGSVLFTPSPLQQCKNFTKDPSGLCGAHLAKQRARESQNRGGQYPP